MPILIKGSGGSSSAAPAIHETYIRDMSIDSDGNVTLEVPGITKTSKILNIHVPCSVTWSGVEHNCLISGPDNYGGFSLSVEKSGWSAEYYYCDLEDDFIYIEGVFGDYGSVTDCYHYEEMGFYGPLVVFSE